MDNPEIPADVQAEIDKSQRLMDEINRSELMACVKLTGDKVAAFASLKAAWAKATKQPIDAVSNAAVLYAGILCLGEKLAGLTVRTDLAYPDMDEKARHNLGRLIEAASPMSAAAIGTFALVLMEPNFDADRLAGLATIDKDGEPMSSACVNVQYDDAGKDANQHAVEAFLTQFQCGRFVIRSAEKMAKEAAANQLRKSK